MNLDAESPHSNNGNAPNVSSELPEEFMQSLAVLEESYLATDDPIRQSGFGGGAERWRAERGAILEAIDEDGDIIDIGCANGYLLECLVKWGKEKGITLTPFGLDQGEQLIELAKKRFPGLESHFFAGNAWNWTPPRRFKYVYFLYDCVPEEYLAEMIRRLLNSVVEPGGRLIVGAYGSRSRGYALFDIAGFLEFNGFNVIGKAQGGNPSITSFAWVTF